jgi:hypothetical protein
MAMLSQDPQVALGRAYPFEDRYLTYLVKRELLLDRREFTERLSADQLCDFDDDHLAGYPWQTQAAFIEHPGEVFSSTAQERVSALWQLFSAKARQAAPGARLYAEKAPAWLPAFLRDFLPALTLYLFRDPRDVFLSANAFMRQQDYYGFGRAAGDSDLDHARSLAYEYLLYYENYRADRGRADCHLVRYAELVRDRSRLADYLGRLLGVHLTGEGGGDDLKSHRTSANLADSLERWRREPLPPGVQELLETTLFEAMAALGYEVAATTVPVGPAVEFSRLAEGLSPLPHSRDGVPAPADESGMRVTLSGEDFWVVLPLEPFQAEGVREVWVSLCGQAGDHCSLYWSPEGGDFSEERCLHLRFHPGQHWQVLRFRTGRHPLWRGTVARLRVDPFNGRPCRGEAPLWVRWVRTVG